MSKRTPRQTATPSYAYEDKSFDRDRRSCDACWVEFPTVEELDQHAEMEEMVDWPIDGMSERRAEG